MKIDTILAKAMTRAINLFCGVIVFALYTSISYFTLTMYQPPEFHYFLLYMMVTTAIYIVAGLCTFVLVSELVWKFVYKFI